MPFYEVQHTYALTASQQQAIAQHITTLHSTTFLTPSLFVNVVFQHLQPETHRTTYFLAGQPVAHNAAGPNRILGMVRQGASRTKADFDRLAKRIEDAWDEVVSGKGKGDGNDQGGGLANGNATTESNLERKAKKLHFIVFYPMLAAREAGTVIPGAGEEASWLKDNMAYFRSQAHDYDDDDFKGLLEEVERRDDLKALIS